MDQNYIYRLFSLNFPPYFPQQFWLGKGREIEREKTVPEVHYRYFRGTKRQLWRTFLENYRVSNNGL